MFGCALRYARLEMDIQGIKAMPILMLVTNNMRHNQLFQITGHYKMWVSVCYRFFVQLNLDLVHTEPNPV